VILGDKHPTYLSLVPEFGSCVGHLEAIHTFTINKVVPSLLPAGFPFLGFTMQALLLP
jgi:hypothetical protein